MTINDLIIAKQIPIRYIPAFSRYIFYSAEWSSEIENCCGRHLWSFSLSVHCWKNAVVRISGNFHCQCTVRKMQWLS